jgi:monomeric type NADP-dependent isocitrate dehydrogenase
MFGIYVLAHHLTLSFFPFKNVVIVIIDASMPVVIRDSGKMWNKMDELEDCKCVIPDRCYATIYQEVINYVKTKGQFDVATMGNVANVGLMARKAEEYGSHDKTFELPADGKVTVKDKNSGEVYFEHKVEQGTYDNNTRGFYSLPRRVSPRCIISLFSISIIA